MAEPATGLTPAPAGGQPPLSFGPAPITPGFDVIDLLPPAAADKLRMLRQRAADAHAVVPEFEEVRQASMSRSNAENALKRLTNHPHDHGFNLKPDDPRVIAAQRTLDKATADFERLQERQAARAAAWRASSQALAAVEDWLKNGRPHGTVLEDVEVNLPKPAKGENGLLDQIENRRRRVRELKAAKHTIESAPHPSAWAKQKVRAEIEALAARGVPDPTNVLEHGGALVWPTSRVQSEVYGAERALAFTEVPDTLALVAWLHRDVLIAALDREIAAEADDKAALTHEARQEREAEVMADLLAVERDESALVWRAMDEKLPVEFRADINPLALLGVALVTAPRAIDGPSTSPLAYDIVRPDGRRR